MYSRRLAGSPITPCLCSGTRLFFKSANRRPCPFRVFFFQGQVAKPVIQKPIRGAKKLTYVAYSYDNSHLHGWAIVIKWDLKPRYNCIINTNKTKVMNSNSSKKTTVSILALAIVLISISSQGQASYAQTSTARISISGTSTLHEWTMTSEKGTYDAVFEINAQGDPQQLTSLVVSVPAESLKSGKSGMDKNAYSALKTDKNKQVTFQLTSAKIDGKSIRCQGTLTIAGTTKQIDIEATYTILADGSIQCKGSKKLAMRDYNVEPPSFMFGSVTTGNEITVSFDVILAAKTQSMSLN